VEHGIKEYKASVWNEMMYEMKSKILALHKGIIIILCNKCSHQMLAAVHHDFDDLPHKKQYNCINNECGHVDYIIV